MARGTILNLSGLLVPVLVQLVTVPLYIRAIGADRYGVMALVWLLLGYFGFFDLGFGRGIASRIAGLADGTAQARAAVVWTGTCLSVLAGAVGGVLLYAVGECLFHNLFTVPSKLLPEAAAALLYVALALPLVTGISALAGALQGREAFGALNASQMTGGVLYQVLPLLAALTWSVGLPGLVLAAIAGRLVTAAMLLFFCVSRLQLRRPGFAFAEVASLLRYGGWVTVTGLISPLLTVFDRLVIGALSGMAAVAAYTIPFNLVMRVGALPSSLQNALFPRFAMLTAAEAERLQGRAVRLIAGAMTPPLVLGVLLMHWFLKLWIGSSLAAAAAPVGQILLLGLGANMLAFIPFGFLQSRGRPDLPAKFHIAELPPYAAALYVLTLHDGAAGAAWAWGARCLADAVLLFAAVRRLPDFRACWPGACLVGAAFAWTRTAGLPLYWPGAVLLAAASVGWAAAFLPAEELRRLRRLVPARSAVAAR